MHSNTHLESGGSIGTSRSHITFNTIQKYDEKIRRTTEELKQIQYERNLLVPICRLPAEILGSIFTFYIDSYSQEHYVYSGTFHQRGRWWVDILLVCRHWCATAYNTPSMWSTPDFRFPRLAWRMLKYSGSTPLNIIWDFHPTLLRDEHRRLFMKVLSSLSRIASLHLNLFSPTIRDLFEDSLTEMANEPAPLLHSLVIDCTEVMYPVILSEDFLGGGAPRLTRLELGGCLLERWRTPLFTNLTHLTIRSMPVTERPSTKVIFEALREAHNLEVLELEYCVSPIPTSLPPNSTISFPRLRILFLSMTDDTCYTLLEPMSFPATTSIHLECYTSSFDWHHIPLIPCISGLLYPASSSADHPRAIRSLMLDSSGFHDGLVLKAWNYSDAEIPHLWFEMNGIATPHTQYFTQKMLGLGPLIHLEALRIFSAEPLSQNIIVENLGKSTSLRSIYLLQRASFGFLKLLSGVTVARKGKYEDSGKKQATAQPILFPSLKTIGLVNVDFRASSSHVLETLLMALRLRTESGFPVERLVLESCIRLYSFDVKRIEEEVVVEWDGLELDL
ncbi:hypothetical protein E1B28_001755 [Marasmius oreades]|uniref:F-box domain-containing protein n=1 Tax=Marasmius oreades TaxID=181124 RepID=A0A9P7V496_9AGAR|nr:uncharacterized protein E1B28_001755 [Marasmius oreades]KAG7099962.1 hypothetical protein E1B28_001755 [Marasmius oreades]